MTTAKSYTLNSDNDNGAFSARQKIGSIAAGGTEIRVRFVASLATALTCVKASVGFDSTAPNATGLTELKFGGASGFSIAAGATITSDWLILTTSAAQNLIVHGDYSNWGARQTNSGGDGVWYKSGTFVEYLTGSVTGYSALGAAFANPVNLVEVQANYTLTAAVGAFSFTGVAVIFNKGFTLAAAAGSFVLTGVAAAFLRSYVVAAAAGAFTLTGVAAALKYGRRFVASVGTFVLTGNAATLSKGIRLVAAAGTFALTGVATVLARQRVAANKFKHRVSQFVLTKLRVTPATLDD